MDGDVFDFQLKLVVSSWLESIKIRTIMCPTASTLQLMAKFEKGLITGLLNYYYFLSVLASRHWDLLGIYLLEMPALEFGNNSLIFLKLFQINIGTNFKINQGVRCSENPIKKKKHKMMNTKGQSLEANLTYSICLLSRKFDDLC